MEWPNSNMIVLGARTDGAEKFRETPPDPSFMLTGRRGWPQSSPARNLLDGRAPDRGAPAEGVAFQHSFRAPFDNR